MLLKIYRTLWSLRAETEYQVYLVREIDVSESRDKVCLGGDLHRCVSIVPTALHIAQEVPQPADEDDDDHGDENANDDIDACEDNYACAHLVVRLGLM